MKLPRFGRLWLVGGAIAITGLLAVMSGAFPLSASSGHWAVTDWLLHFGMRRTVKARSLDIAVPALGTRDQVLRGAGHYQTACVSCHGAPGMPRDRVVREMTPEPPELVDRIARWQPDELFWIVKHGVKFTAMPAWPAQGRDDEVWAMVSFLLELRELDEARYRALASGEASDSPASLPGVADRGRLREVIDECARCHGYDGHGRGGAFPRLDRLSAAYIHASLSSYANEARASGIMQAVAVQLDDGEMRAVARYYAGRSAEPTVAATGDAPPDLRERGREIAGQGIARLGVPACAHCHGPNAVTDHPLFPPLAGQSRDYLATQLRLWREEQRGGTAYAALMTAAVRRLTGPDAAAVAAYYASLPAEERSPHGR